MFRHLAEFGQIVFHIISASTLLPLPPHSVIILNLFTWNLLQLQPPLPSDDHHYFSSKSVEKIDSSQHSALKAEEDACCLHSAVHNDH